MRFLTRQEIFNKAYNGVVAQGCKSSKEDQCRYRADLSRSSEIKCGIGHLIADEDYHTSMEGGTIASLLNGECPAGGDQMVAALKKAGVDVADIEFLQKVQSAHDQITSGSYFVYGFKGSMSVVADRYGLTVPDSI